MHKRGEGIERLRTPTILTCIYCFCVPMRRGVQFAYVLNEWPLCPSTLSSSRCFCSGQYRTSCACLLHDMYVFIIIASCLHQLNRKSMYLNWSTEELIDQTLIASSLGNEKTKALPGFYALAGCDTVEKFTSIKRSMDKIVPSGWQQNLKCFLQVSSRTFQWRFWSNQQICCHVVCSQIF